jgi:predicted DCC family thiol-disulfide oxidoreductase YuxK
MTLPIGWVLYDDSCGFCRRWIPFWSDTLCKRGFAIAPLQSDWVGQKLNVPYADLLFDLRLLLADGRQLRGADVYRFVMRRIWWAYPLYLLSVAPVLRRVFDWSYRTFANNRYRISRACRLSASRCRPNLAAGDDRVSSPS